MKNKNFLNTTNWVVFTAILLLGVVTAAIALYDLNSTIHVNFSDEWQSHAGFRWGSFNKAISVIILVMSSFLAVGWKRLFPFNVPIAIIIVGFSYLLIFHTFTVGWIATQGMIGFFIAFLTGVVLIAIYLSFNFLENRKTEKNHSV